MTTTTLHNAKLPTFDYKSFKCLADNLHHEARGEGTKGLIAVANVVINSVKSSSYPASICDVVHQQSQFSWTLEQEKVQEDVEHTHQIYTITMLALRGTLVDVTNGATHYYSTIIKQPYWAKTMVKTAKIGKHIFYKRKQGKTK